VFLSTDLHVRLLREAIPGGSEAGFRIPILPWVS